MAKHDREAAPGIPGHRGGQRRTTLALIVLAGLVTSALLGLSPSDLIPSEGGLAIAGDFFSRAWRPALSYQSPDVPDSAPPLLLKALAAAMRTVIFAAAGMSLALIPGVLLGFASSSAWWNLSDGPSRSGLLRWIARVGPLIYGPTRLLIALMRSVHELLWAVLFLAAFGLSHLSAVIAIAIPFGGTLAKIFSEMIDEAPRDSAAALEAAGAGTLQTFCFGLIPRALPDMTAYAFYRFECALRSSAILGFFGFPTLGYYLSASFENLYYGEVWTYLYTLFGLVALFDWWSGAIRKRLMR